MPLTAKDLVERMPDAFLPEKAQGVNATIQYYLDGEGGGMWVIRIADGKCTVEEGEVDDPDVTISMDAQDYVDLILGNLDPAGAMMAGKLRISGNFALATKLMSFFKVR